MMAALSGCRPLILNLYMPLRTAKATRPVLYQLPANSRRKRPGQRRCANDSAEGSRGRSGTVFESPAESSSTDRHHYRTTRPEVAHLCSRRGLFVATFIGPQIGTWPPQFGPQQLPGDDNGSTRAIMDTTLALSVHLAAVFSRRLPAHYWLSNGLISAPSLLSISVLPDRRRDTFAWLALDQRSGPAHLYGPSMGTVRPRGDRRHLDSSIRPAMRGNSYQLS